MRHWIWATLSLGLIGCGSAEFCTTPQRSYDTNYVYSAFDDDPGVEIAPGEVQVHRFALDAAVPMEIDSVFGWLDAPVGVRADQVDCDTAEVLVELDSRPDAEELNQQLDLACNANDCQVDLCIQFTGTGAEVEPARVGYIVNLMLWEEIECGVEADHPDAWGAPIEVLDRTIEAR